MARRLFISYSHHDSDLLGELRVHLRPLERSHVIAPWFDGYLIPGDDFDHEVRQALAASDRVLTPEEAAGYLWSTFTERLGR